ncbi:MAG: gamma-glutamylcyclotransferase family protein [Chloroflexota bacterium]
MSILGNERFAGVEDEFRVVGSDGRGVLIDELVRRSERFFFDEAVHVPVIKGDLQQEQGNGRIWTWYGGTLYHDYDAAGSLVEATTPLVLLRDGVDTLVDCVLTQRAQLLELCRECQITGVSTHLNLTLDSFFAGDDLCRFEASVPSDEFVSVPAQKLGADIALLTTHTVAPVLAFLLFNRYPRKGALYRPRKNRRMELCLPHVTEPEQMRAGFAFWFAAVEYFTSLIKADLSKYRNWQERYRSPDYFRALLPHFPVVIRDVAYQRPNYVMGYQVSSLQETNVMEMGSQAMIGTDQGEMTVVDMGKAYTESLSHDILRFGGAGALSLIEDYLTGQKSPMVDFDGTPRFFSLHTGFIEATTGKSVRAFLGDHRVIEPATIHLKFLESPCRVLSVYSRRLPMRLTRNLGTKLDWNHITLEVVEEDEYVVTQHLLEVPLSEVADYLRAEDYCGTPYVFLAEIKRWTKAVNTVSNPRTIFAYGTLMSPERNERRFGAIVTEVRRGHAYGEAYDFGDFPVIIDDLGGGIVHGVVITLGNFEETAARFDDYEGSNDPNPVFSRVIREVMIEGFHRVPAWVYVGNRNNRYVADKLLKARRLTGVWSKHGFRIHEETRRPEPC